MRQDILNSVLRLKSYRKSEFSSFSMVVGRQ